MDSLAAPEPSSVATGQLRPVAAFEYHADEALLVVPLIDGAADLDAVVVLNGTAGALWRSITSGAEEPALAKELVVRHGLSDEVARRETRSFMHGLWSRGLLAGSGAPTSGLADQGSAVRDPGEPSAAAAPGFLTPSQAVALARAALARGQRLRFRARGCSMSPQIPHGTTIEVSPRALAQVRRGDVVLYVAGDSQLVAHRVLSRRAGILRARGDSAARVDIVAAADFLGVVTARLQPASTGWVRVPLDTRLRRGLGCVSSALHRGMRAAVRWLLVKPLRASPRLRRCARHMACFVSRVLGAAERRHARWRRGFDIVAAALMTTTEKDAGRRALYARPSLRTFTALDENVEAGLTLIEEIAIARHPLPEGEVLVLGCGPGRECVALARKGRAVTGLDRDQGMLAAARALAERSGVALDLVLGEADAFDLPGRCFGAVLVFSGLYNMVLPRARRVALLRCAAAHLLPGGRVYLTFLSDYAAPGDAPPPQVRSLGHSIDEDYETGDLWLRNEAVHIFPHSDRLRREVDDAGLRVVTLFRDQRAYDRATRQVRGFVILERKS